MAQSGGEVGGGGEEHVPGPEHGCAEEEEDGVGGAGERWGGEVRGGGDGLVGRGGGAGAEGAEEAGEGTHFLRCWRRGMGGVEVLGGHRGRVLWFCERGWGSRNGGSQLVEVSGWTGNSSA